MTRLNLKPRIARRLYEALEKEHNENGRTVWPAGSHIILGKKWDFTLHYDVIARRSESKWPEPRFEWIKKLRPFEDGKDRHIYPVEGTLSPIGLKQRGHLGKIKQKKMRLIKHQLHNSRSHPVTNADTEYNIAHQSGKIRMKRPVFFDNSSLLVMKQFPGRDLYHLLYTSKRVLSITQQITLTRNLLAAYRHWVYNAGLVHRDIKPENITARILRNGLIDVNIIDFGLGIKRGGDDTMAGTPGYLAPEQYNGFTRQEVSQDLFALACVIAEIWYIDEDAVTEMYKKQSGTGGEPPQPGDWRLSLCSLFSFGTRPCEPARKLIHETLHRMLDPDPRTRLTLADAEAAFLNIELVLASHQKKREFHRAGSSARSSRMLCPPSGLRPPSGDRSHHFFSAATRSKSMEENRLLRSGSMPVNPVDAPCPRA
ncbi:protein kinase domain-containing protein [Legionella sp. CNM-4043-24]|uniref:protein kinase domain-containing protein n=1 Tax=Legionella sp. CNM-4043-24 TaxID=3421646 RepID=UPI00403ADD2D